MSDIVDQQGGNAAEISISCADEGNDTPVSPATVESASEAQPSADDGRESASSDSMTRVEKAIEAAVERVLDAFERKLAYDTSKQLQVDRLHAELQEHRAGLALRAARPIVHGMIRLHDNIGKLVTALHNKPSDELSPAHLFALFEGLQEDIEIILAQNGVAAYREPSQTFDPRRQRAVRAVVTHDPQLGGCVAEPLRPGFEQGGEILEKERVVVYQWQAPPPQSESQLQDQEC